MKKRINKDIIFPGNHSLVRLSNKLYKFLVVLALIWMNDAFLVNAQLQLPAIPSNTQMSNQFEYSSEYIYRVQSGSEFLEDGAIIAYVNGQLRGAQTASVLFPPTGLVEYKVRVYSNTSSGDSITFRYYDIYNAKVYEITEGEVFAADNVPDYYTPTLLNTYCGAPGIVTGLLPEDLVTGQNATVDLFWQPSENTTNYSLYLWKEGDSTPLNPYIDNIYGTSRRVSNLAYGDTYHWFVLSVNQCLQDTSNTQTFTIRELPDLIVTQMSAEDTVFSASSFDINFTVKNQESGSTTSTLWYDAVYISNDNVFSGDDRLLLKTERRQALDADSSYNQLVSVSVPSDYAGNYYLFVVTDQTNRILETDKGNNTIQQASAIFVNEKPLPDVKVSGVTSSTTSIQPGDTIEILWSVENIGDASAIGGWSEKVSIISLSGIRVSLSGSSQFSGVLDQTASISRNHHFILPEIFNFSGEAYIEVELIPSNELVEYPGNETNNSASSLNRISLLNKLYLTIPESVKENYTGLLRCYISRSGNYTEELRLNLTSSVSGEITIPASVTIPARSSSAVFNITPVDNASLEGSRNISIEASAPDYSPQSQILNILDDEIPTITLSFNKTSVSEGDTLILSLSRDLSGPDSSVIYLSSNQSAQWIFPNTAIIEANQLSTQIEVFITEDAIPELNAEVSISARAEGLISGSATTTILDDDIPLIELEILTDSVSEGAGPYATWGVIRRLDGASSSIRVNLSADSPNALFFPSSVSLNSGVVEKQFNIGVVDNGTVDGYRTIELSGNIYISSCNCNTTSDNGGVVRSELTIVDNDGPSLTVKINPASLAEGKTNAGIMTIFRNTSTVEALELTLSTNDDSELSIPPTAIILAGMTNVQVPIDTKDDNIDDGSQLVTLQANASGFSPGIAWVYVTDINRPDLEISDIELLENSVITGNQMEVHAIIQNNGYGTAPSGVKVNLYLSEDEKIDDNDTVIYQSSFSESIAIGQSVQYLELATVPKMTGDYYLLAKVNPDADISELLYINNESSSVPLRIEPNYSGTAFVDDDVFLEPIPVRIYGEAILLDGTPAANADLDVYIICNGIRREIKVVTDRDGSYSTIFEPYSYESGHYVVGACFPGQGLSTEQDAFDILGMERSSKTYLTWDIKRDVPSSGTIGMTNKSNIPLTNLVFETLSVPEGFELSIDTIDVLPGNGSIDFNYTLLGREVTAGINYLRVPVKVSSAEGISFEFTAYYHCQALGSHLESNPASINTTMTKGKSRYYDLKIFNSGAGETGKVSIELPHIEWMTLASTDSLETLEPGDTITVSLLLSPNDDLPLNAPLTGRIVAHNSNGDDLSIPYRIEMVSEETGGLSVDVVDEYTYFTEEAPHVKNAHVVVRHPYSGQVVAEGFTNEDGIFEVDSLAEGSYKINVDVEKHESYQNTIIIDPGRVNEQSVFLSFQAITYTWEVVPTEIEDSYEIELVMEYETNVPAPVVIMEMPNEMPQLVNDETYTFMVTLTNKGLITALDVGLFFPDNDPEYEWITNFTTTDLLAQQAIQIPVMMRNKNSLKSARSADNTNSVESTGPCSDYSITIYGFECGANRQINRTSALFTISGRNCSEEGDGGYTFDWDVNPSDGPGPIGDDGGGGSSYSPIDMVPQTSTPSTGCDPCLISVLQTILGCGGGLPGHILACLWGFTDGDVSFLDVAGCVPGPTGCTAGVISSFLTCYDSPPWGEPEFKKSSLFVDSGNDLQNSSSSTAPPIMLQAIRDLEYVVYNNDAERDYLSEYMGSLDWTLKESFEDFAAEIDSVVTNKFSFDLDIVNRTKLRMQGTDISNAEIDDFVDRWNMTMEAWEKGIFSPNNDYPGIIDHNLLDLYEKKGDTVSSYVQSRGYRSVNEMYTISYQILKDEAIDSRSSVCASVSIKISQKLVMTREAFEGTLTIFNGHTSTAMEEIELNIEIRDENGELSNDLFQIDTKTLDILTGIDGTGSLGAELTGSATILFIPEKGAAPEVPKSYSFGGSFSYLDPFTGVTLTKPLFPVTLQVNPSPDLFLHYFMQRDILGDDALTEPIEPIIPAELAVMIVNNGYGTAKNVRIESAQPEIIDNEKGLSIHFALIGSNLNGQPTQLGLTDIDFGNILPKTSTVGQWWFTSDLLGHFVNYEANVTHLDSRGNPDLSLISGAELHELIRSVRSYGATDDGINDFLVNEVQDSKEQPDVIYMSQGDILMDVFGADAGIFEGAIQAPLLTNTLKVIVSKIGWNYIKLSDPGYGKYEIISVTRNYDQQEIPLDNVWLSHVTLRDGKEPIYENKFHFVDLFEDFGENDYTIVWKLKDPDPPGIVSIEGIPQSFVSQALTSVTVKFNKEINLSTFTYHDMFLRFQGGEDIMDSTVVITKIDELNYSVDLSALTTGNGFYVLTVQAAEIEDMGGTTGNVGKQVSWAQFLSVPVVEEFIGLPDENFGSSFDFLLARFNLPIDINTLTPADFILAKDGIPVGGTLMISIMDTEAKLFKISGLGSLMTSDGKYSLTVDLLNIASIDGAKGLLQQSVEWNIDTTPPNIFSFAKIMEGGFDEQHVTGMEIIFSEGVSGFNIGSVELWKDNLQQAFSQVHFDSLSNNTHELSEFRMLTYYSGTYTLRVDMNSVYDRAGISGSGIIEYEWVVDRTAPSQVENLRISPDLGYSDTDGITSTRSLTAIMDVVDEGNKIELYRNDFGTLTFLADSSNVMTGELSIDINFPSAGHLMLEVHCIDENNNFSVTQLAIVVDEKAFQVSFQEVPEEPVLSHPELIKLVFSEKILESSLLVENVALRFNGNVIDLGDLAIQKISDSIFTVSGFSNIEMLPGDYTLSVDLEKIQKYLSGMPGTYVATANWTILDINVAPVAHAGEDFNIVPGTQYWLDGSESYDPDSDQLTYEWFPPEGIILDDDYIVNASFTAPQDTGTNLFTFILLVSDGFLTCTDKINVYLESASGIDNLSEDSNILIYPNPSSEYFTISVYETVVSSIRLIDVTGKVIIHRLWSGEKEQTIQLNHIPKGIYFVQIYSSDKIIMKKIIIL